VTENEKKAQSKVSIGASRVEAIDGIIKHLKSGQRGWMGEQIDDHLHVNSEFAKFQFCAICPDSCHRGWLP
jgi:hypothetical protein